LPLACLVTLAIDAVMRCEIVPRPPRPDKGEEEEDSAGLFAPSGEFHSATLSPSISAENLLNPARSL